MELWSPPRDAPHLYEWWRPLVQASRRARVERLPWPVHLDEFRLAGRVTRRDRPDVWIYEHHANGGALCVDASGGAYRFVATPGTVRAPGGDAAAGGSIGQFRVCTLAEALRRAGLPGVVGRVVYTPPDDTPAEGPEPQPEPRPAVASVGGSGPPSRVIRRGHLTLVAG